jgi:hypothetical protein
LSQIKPADFFGSSFSSNNKKIRLEPEPSRARLDSITSSKLASCRRRPGSSQNSRGVGNISGADIVIVISIPVKAEKLRFKGAISNTAIASKFNFKV